MPPRAKAPIAVTLAPGDTDRKFQLVGGGIAAMAAAAFLVRDAGIAGHQITIIEESDRIGGSLDGAGTAEEGYVLRGGRMLESRYVCTFDLFDSIPTLDLARSVTAETLDWNRTMKTSSRSRLVRGGMRQTVPAFGLSEADMQVLEGLIGQPEAQLGHTSIADHFDPSFFASDFWFMWCTTFAFQPWHGAAEFRRYLIRFAHMVGGFDRLQGIMRTVYNPYDSLVRPLYKWLEMHGVNFAINTKVTSLDFGPASRATVVTSIATESAGRAHSIAVAPDDIVLVTLGSMTEAAALGSMDQAAALGTKADGGAWKLWETIAQGRPRFGNPTAFDSHIDESKWLSFTVTMEDLLLLQIVAGFNSTVPGEGGLITFPDSAWLASLVIPYQPCFIDQPDDVSVLWGYGLRVDAIGNFVPKPMAECTGREILTEIMGHLDIARDAMAPILETSICIPCMMPFITSQFLPREPGDRPQVVPAGSTNLGFMGQFCELPDDVVFTIEYSIRSAQTAVQALLGLKRGPPSVIIEDFNPRDLFKPFMARHPLDA